MFQIYKNSVDFNSYKLIVAYDGTNYFGWQYQPDKVSIQKIMEDRFYAVFKRKINTQASSRTDAGVHALGQIVKFSTDIDILPEKLMDAWNNALPNDILIRNIKPVDQCFNPRINVEQKIYFYHIFNKRPLPFTSRYGYFPKYKLSNGKLLINDTKLIDCLNIFIGTHDYRSFCTGESEFSTIRTINSIKLDYINRFQAYRITVKGPGFLRYMIRRIVGASLDIATTERSKDEIISALAQKDPNQRLYTAPAQGLALYKVTYKI